MRCSPNSGWGGTAIVDPLAEFAEWLVAALLEGTLAPSPVQAHWDVEAPGVGKVQVKYLANSGNETG